MKKQGNVLERVLEDKLRELSVRILQPQPNGLYEHQGSGLLYLADNGKAYVLTAAHVLEKFENRGQVVVECYPDAVDSGRRYLDKYMFSVPMEDVWTSYEEKVPMCSDANSFDEKDVAVIPLTGVRDWMKHRNRAYFMPEAGNQSVRRGIGYGYPAYSGSQDISNACSRLNEDICCDLYTEKKHRFKWICSKKLSYDERHGLSGSLVTMHGVRSVIMTSVVQSTYANHDGNVILGTDLHWIREMLTAHNVPIREADPEAEKQTFDYINQIATYLKKDCEESLSCTVHGMDLRSDIKDRYRSILEKVLDVELSDLGNDRPHCIDYGCADAQIAVRIAPTASQSEIAQTLKAYQIDHMEPVYPHMILVAVTDDAGCTVIPHSSGHLPLSRQDIWDIPRLVREISRLKINRIEEIFRNLDQMQLSNCAVELPKHLLPSVPNPSDHFIHGSRDEDIARLKKILNRQGSNQMLFISGVGGIGKTELAIQLAWYCKPPKGAYFLRYVGPQTDKDGHVTEGMMATILNAEFSGHERNVHTDKQAEYQIRKDFLKKEYKGALLVVDNFDCQGQRLGELRTEQSYRDLTTSGIQVIFTTRYDLDKAPGYKIEPISEDHLLALMRSNFAENYATESELRELIRLVENHTLAVILMAKTLKEGNSLITAEDIRKLLTNGPDPSFKFPLVESDQNGIFVRDTLFGHLQKLLNPASLNPKEKAVLGCLMLLPKQGIHLPHFIKSLTRNNAMYQNDVFNALHAKGWVNIDREAQRIKMNPVLCCICRHELALEPELCKNFLEGLWEKCGSLRPGDEKQLELTECFENAAKLIGDPSQSEKWKERAYSIRSTYQVQEVRI